MIGRILGNRYEILEEIGEGGMAKVYKAKCHLLNRIVAIKILRPEFAADEDFVKKFRRESQAAASLSHPNIVSIYDVGQEGNIYYIVMEYINGHTLKKLISENGGPLEVKRAIEIARQVCKALDHAHKNRIIHRDIKPQNILVTEEDVAKVTDFGIARAANGSTITYTGDVVGTAYYFSPEQAKGGIVDERTDIYSLGIVLYEMLTGKVPFEGDSPISVALKHIQEEIIPPSRLNEKVPKELDQIVLKATQKDVNLRYQTAADFLKDLDTFLRNPKELNFKEEEITKTRVIPSKDVEELKKAAQKKEKEKKRRNVIKKITIALLILLLMASLSYGTIYVLNNFFKVNDVVVPNIVGLSLNQASKILSDHNLNMEISEEQYSDKPENTILSQDPSQGSVVKAGSTVYVVISKGRQVVVVPNVINKDYLEAKNILENMGLKANIIEQYNDQFAKGYVFDQNPRQGVQVEYNTAIDLYVSKGQQPAIMPNVVNMTLEEATTALENAGLKLGKVIYKETTEVPEGVVLEQSVSPDSEIQKGSTIDLIVSKMPQASLQQQTKNVIIELPNKQGTMKVDVYVIQNGQKNLIYSAQHTYQDSPLTVPVTAYKGKATIEVDIDGEVYSTVEARF
ncbi:serine/threonine protein kinase with PASTA sensor(s) [Thermoanaerobacter mathranii subsp. mathranii str. A3]|uniref:non-specific serine/threonine protein kinase n=1 Tax=Thermoanaerobacter mathranii subsp. mathranii (strain DSM 11426 / CCUG 53645 / CIP 108742 / A3) TaxID=583358 RepID=A0ABM5LQN4_THEM3|nr:Stk1 family PASTA domain-containing Ser/Thr kinase [Thermoanaerobacter mathranii]ADH61070.1 serine/threonine protein kinase with PASTA sensor(s) [Thermoanaerobacter mathranii subsp. mathranii str. A3]